MSSGISAGRSGAGAVPACDSGTTHTCSRRTELIPVVADVTFLSRNLHLQEVVKSRHTSLMGTLILHELVTLLESRVLVTFQDPLKFMCKLLRGVFSVHHPLVTSETAVSHVHGGGKVLHKQSDLIFIILLGF